MNGKNLAPVRRTFRQRASAVGLGLFASLYGFAAMAATTPVQDVTSAIDAGKADAITIAVAVVVTLWAIWSIYLMRRKG